MKGAVKRAARAASRDIERVRHSTLPADAKQQLEEAQKELDAQP